MNELRQLIFTKESVQEDINGYNNRIKLAEAKLSELSTMRHIKYKTRKATEAKLLMEIKTTRQMRGYAEDALEAIIRNEQRN